MAGSHSRISADCTVSSMEFAVQFAIMDFRRETCGVCLSQNKPCCVGGLVLAL